ncbi:MAG: hypothetical protein RR400_02095 [Clostridia bacterium]
MGSKRKASFTIVAICIALLFLGLGVYASIRQDAIINGIINMNVTDVNADVTVFAWNNGEAVDVQNPSYVFGKEDFERRETTVIPPQTFLEQGEFGANGEPVSDKNSIIFKIKLKNYADSSLFFGLINPPVIENVKTVVAISVNGETVASTKSGAIKTGETAELFVKLYLIDQGFSVPRHEIFFNIKLSSAPFELVSA